MSFRFVFAAVLGLGLSASAQNAQDELERQLKEMVGKPPTKLLVEYEGLDQPNYKLVDVSFDLDGSSLPVPSLEKLNSDGRHLIFHGDVKPGKHSLETTVVLTDVAGVLFSYEAGFKWTVKNTRSFEQAPGLEVRVVITPEMSPSEKDPKKKFTLKSTAVPKMLAKLEDGTMPDVPKPNLAKADEPDAGVVASADLSPAEKAKILKAEQAEAARLKKQQAMEDAKRKKEDAAAARAAALEEKKRMREEALAAKKAAAEDKKRQKAEALAAAKAATEKPEKTPVEASPQPSEPAPPEPVAEAIDAGGPVVAAVETPKPVQTAISPAEPESSGFPLPIIIGVAVALLGIIIFFATRKKAPPQY